MTDDEVVRTVRERTLLREFDRASALAARLRSRLEVVERARADVVAQMRQLMDDNDGEVDDGAAR